MKPKTKDPGPKADHKKGEPQSLASVVRNHQRLVIQLINFSGWSQPWVENLWTFCNSLRSPESGTVSRLNFTREMFSLFGLTSSLIVDRTFDVHRAFSPEQKLYPDALFKGIVTMLTTDLEVKIDYVFDIYDMKSDGTISFEELSTSFKDCLYEEDLETKEEGTREIIEIVRKSFDVNSDGFINRQEFRARVHQNEIVLEILGRCLPRESCRRTFLDLISPKRNSYYSLQRWLAKRKEDTFRHFISTKPKEDQFYPILIVMPSIEDIKRKK